MKLILVRHGATEWSANGRHTGTTNVHLTESGFAQAETARVKVHAMVGHTFAISWSSPLARARQTADIVLGGTPYNVDERLREFDYGDYEGLTTAQIRSRSPGWTVWDGCPNGETVADVAARADAFLVEARACPASIGIVFAHGHLLRILAARAIGQPGELGRHLGLDTAAVSVIDDLRDGAALTLWNDVGHGTP